MFPRGVAEAIGIELPDFASDHDRVHYLAGSKLHAVTHLVALRIREMPDLAWEAEVDFILEDPSPLPFGLLGQEGFLNKWVVSFNYQMGYFVVEPIEEFEERLPLDPYEELQSRFPDPYG